MRKQDILEYFKDIDFMYNDSSRLNTLSKMIDELQEEKEAHWIKKSCDALYCSNCDAPSINKQPYCYLCGSKMT